ncbi:MAG TPA: HAD hydrolase family protein [Terracidiphilus sp.]|jgi:3-deoxy-D-manno-octulosonate 8-phosphate phosphatase (KDO 8-P phosphatase)|nr:HAD hydrolase family protein [Terracidiphilus sp.]
MADSDLAKSHLAKIRAVALDVDGVLTDGGLWWGPAGEEWKRFCFADIMGISLARRAGFDFAMISGEDSPLIDRYAQKMMIRHVVKGCRDKRAALLAFSASVNIPLAEVCYMGDDVNDLPAMRVAGFSAAPANAAKEILPHAHFVAKSNGGNGAVRELIEKLLEARGLSASSVYSNS